MMSVFVSIGVYALAALAEIAGCFAFWAWLRLDRSAFWLIPGAISLALFAYLLTRVEVEFAGRAYAAYGGIYIAASIAWLWAVEGLCCTNRLMAEVPLSPDRLIPRAQ